MRINEDFLDAEDSRDMITQNADTDVADGKFMICFTGPEDNALRIKRLLRRFPDVDNVKIVKAYENADGAVVSTLEGDYQIDMPIKCVLSFDTNFRNGKRAYNFIRHLINAIWNIKVPVWMVVDNEQIQLQVKYLYAVIMAGYEWAESDYFKDIAYLPREKPLAATVLTEILKLFCVFLPELEIEQCWLEADKVLNITGLFAFIISNTGIRSDEEVGGGFLEVPDMSGRFVNAKAKGLYPEKCIIQPGWLKILPSERFGDAKRKVLASRAFYKCDGSNTYVRFINFCGLWAGSPLFVDLTCPIAADEDVREGELDSMEQMKVDLKKFYYNKLSDEELEQIDQAVGEVAYW